MIKLSEIIKSGKVLAERHSSEILTGIGITGLLSTTIMAVRITPKALRLIEKKKHEANATKLTPIETIKATWKCYVPPVITAGLSVACLLGATSVNARRNAALATAYTLSENALKEYKQKVIETIGEKKEQKLTDEIAKDKLVRDPVSNKEVFITNKGDTLCYDVISGRYFKTDIDKLKKAINELNRNMLDEMYISLNDFYYEIGIGNTRIGDELGWNISDGFIDLKFSSQLTEDATPCLVIDYRVAPKYNYCKLS